MTASALNTASMSVPAAAAQGGGSTPNAAAGAAPGFDALVAALLPQDAPAPGAAAPETAAPDVSPIMPAASDEEAPPEGQPATTEAADTASADAAATALAASLAGQQPTTAPTQTTTATDPSATAHAWGRDKAKGTPAQPALLHANPKADLAGKIGPAPEGLDDAVPPPSELPETAPAAVAAQPTPRASGQAVDRAALPSAVVSNMPAPVTDAVVDAPAAPTPPPADTAVLEAANDQATVLAAASQPGAKAEAPVPPPPRSQRSERGKAAADTDAPSALKATEAVDKPVHAKAVDAAAKPAAASADARSPDTLEPEVEGAADADDSAVPLDAKSASQASAPAAHTTHAVRGSPETVATLAAQIVKKLEGQSTRFDLELNPNGLGKVDVRIEIGAQGQLSASMLFDNAQAAHELKSRATELQRALEQAGFDLSGGLSFDVADQGRHQGQAWQDQAEAGHAFRGQAFRAALETAGDADIATQGALRLRRGVNAGLDLRI